MPPRTLAFSLIIAFLACTVMYIFAGGSGGFSESSLQIDRLWLVDHGKLPYLDFEYPYGAGQLYVPLLLQRALQIGPASAYYIFWGISVLLGILLLFVVINMIDYPTPSKRVIFLLLYSIGLPSVLCMGTHYTLLRFTCPLFFVLVIYRVSKEGSGRGLFYAPVLLITFTAILLLLSPEMALAHTFACAFILFPSLTTPHIRTLFLYISSLLLVAAELWIALKLHVLDTARAFSAGGNSFPISPAPHILLYFFAVLVCASYIVHKLSTHAVNDNTVAVIAFSVAMVPAALQRCDPTHVLWNGEGLFLVSLFYLSNNRRAMRWYATLLVVFLALIPTAVGLLLWRQTWLQTGYNFVGNSGGSRASRGIVAAIQGYIDLYGDVDKQAKWRAVVSEAKERMESSQEIDFAALYPGWTGRALAPLGYKPNGVGTYLSDRIDYGYYRGFENAITVHAVREKVEEMRLRPQEAILLPVGFRTTCQVDADGSAAQIAWLFAFPYFGKAVHLESIRRPFCDYVLAQYELKYPPEKDNFHYGLWVAKPS